MNLSYAWLKELVAVEESPAELAARLTHAGCAVEELQPAGDDTRMIAEITSNRPDWLGHIGVAREIAALTGGAVTLPEIALPAGGPPVDGLTSVTMEAAELCPRYTARVIRGVTIGESPDWLKRRLEALGLRPINNVVDITNYVLYEMNHPLHAFDLGRLDERRIVVRRARAGETLTAIDGSLCKLTDAMLVIADATRPVAVAGVMGGAETEVGPKTTDILLEAATFEPKSIRRTARTLKLHSDSSYRFERQVDAAGVERASARACQLILDLAGGELAEGMVDTNPTPPAPWEATMRFGRLDALLGCPVPPDEAERVFAGLGLETLSRTEEAITVRVPTTRRDLTREADLIEEVARVIGYDQIPETISMGLIRAITPPLREACEAAREVLAGLGYHECIADPFVPERWLSAYLEGGVQAVRIENPVNTERPLMRASLIPSLLEIRRINRDVREARLFELGRIYLDPAGVDHPERHEERTHLCILNDRGVEAVRGATECLLRELRVEGAVTVEPVEAGAALAEGTAARILVEGNPVGKLGMIDGAQAALHDLLAPVAVAELEFSQLAAMPRARATYTPIPRFPAIDRDLALVVPEAVRWGEIEQAVRERPDRLESVELQSVYRGKGLEAGEKSVAFRMVYRAPDRSLTDAEANQLFETVVAHLTSRIQGARLR